MKRRGIWKLVYGVLTVCVVCVLHSRSFADDSRTARLVESGDMITFYMGDLVGPDRAIRTVQWKKNLLSRKADYVQLAARYEIDGIPGFVVLFVEKASVDRVVYRCPDPNAETCTLTIDPEFQHGGDSDRLTRFLVFHDPANGQFQHRFIDETAARNFANGVRRFSDGSERGRVAVAGFQKVAVSGQKYLGESLRDFSAIETAKPARLVKAGDEITFYTNDLTGPARVVQLVEWQKDLKQKQANYIQLAAQFDAGGMRDFLILFVQEPVVKRLLARCGDSTAMSCTVTVDAEFQYGGDAAGTMRFLVFHNRANQPFQHRFVNQTVAKNFAVGVKGLMEEVDESDAPMFGAELGVASVLRVVEMGQATIGDPLRDF